MYDKLKSNHPNTNNNLKKENKMEIFGLSLTTWLVILAVFAAVTPIVGKQIAKDTLKIKDNLKLDYKTGLLKPILFPMENEKIVDPSAPIQRWKEEEYIKRMMMGGVWGKFLFNIFTLITLFLVSVIGYICYALIALFRGIFSTK